MHTSSRVRWGFFSSARMVGDYNRKFYTPASVAFKKLTADNAAEAKRLVEDNKLYSVYRTFYINGSDKLELYLEERGGTKDEPSSDDSTP